MSKLQEIADWLQNEAEERMKHAMSRRGGARSMENATAAELRAAKRLAEKMSGRKLPLVKTDIESAKADAHVQDRIAAKLETEARCLSDWADYLLSIT